MEELMSICNYINWFFLYSFLGYLLECIVLTVEYKRPVVDRGFASYTVSGQWAPACF